MLGVVVAVLAGGESNPTRSLSSPPTPAAETVAPLLDTDVEGQWIAWKGDDLARAYRVGGYSLTVSPTVDNEGLPAAQLKIIAPDGAALDYQTSGSSWANLTFMVVQMDAADPTRQLIIADYSGGAHCCTEVTVFERRDGRWNRSELGSWDGDVPATPKDLDNDGRKEMVFVDQAFLYAFASYAESAAPPVIKQVHQGKITTPSAELAFRPTYAAYLEEVRPGCLAGSNGACAAFVATAARLGQLDAAWTLMLGAYDQASDWDLPKACRIRTQDACPPEAELTFATYPEALQWFLGKNGYASPVYIEPLTAAGPSFECGAARTAGEQSVCTVPALAMQDRMLAMAYTRASALSRDRQALRVSQRAFLSSRNNLADPAALSALYQNRIELLLAVD
ncbi:lysozyme inhibitor LprI family protein [Brevundimonas nasdae]|uniref:lysozyme inhibitor LprI family protein n=1 Tax=Brevundimonas nasdae TaxID=172043 RepID=UPI0028A13015|nr:hypothetical protein [Brevundimonas nasdae]